MSDRLAVRRPRRHPDPSSWALAVLVMIASVCSSVASGLPRETPAAPLPVAASAEASTPDEPAAPMETATGRERFIASHGFLVRDGGTWRAENPSSQPDPGGWVAYGSSFEWGLDRHIVRVRISGFAESGEEKTFWEGIASWHPGEQAIRLHNFGHGGEVAHGSFEMIDETHNRVELEIHNPDGSSFRIRDAMEILGPDRYRTTSSVWREGEWAKVSERVWERQDG